MIILPQILMRKSRFRVRDASENPFVRYEQKIVATAWSGHRQTLPDFYPNYLYGIHKITIPLLHVYNRPTKGPSRTTYRSEGISLTMIRKVTS